eukprot:5186381-Amphidinium_carterae.1
MSQKGHALAQAPLCTSIRCCTSGIQSQDTMISVTVTMPPLSAISGMNGEMRFQHSKRGCMKTASAMLHKATAAPTSAPDIYKLANIHKFIRERPNDQLRAIDSSSSVKPKQCTPPVHSKQYQADKEHGKQAAEAAHPWPNSWSQSLVDCGSTATLRESLGHVAERALKDNPGLFRFFSRKKNTL